MLPYGHIAPSDMLLALAISEPASPSGSNSPGSDSELLARIADSRDPQALESLYDRYARPVYSVLLRVAGDRSAADELQQDVFLKLWRNAQAFDRTRATALPWLLTLARNTALDRVRTKAERQRRREFGDDETSTALQSAQHGSARNDEAWLDRRRLAEQVAQALEELPEGQRRAVELAYFEGLSQTEIAQKLDAPLGTVKSWVRKALLRLRDDLGGAS